MNPTDENPETHDNDTAVMLAYQRVLPRAMALDPKRLDVFNIQVSYAVGVVLTAMPKLRTLRDAMVRLDGFDPEAIDSLEDCALAMNVSNASCKALGTAPRDLRALRLKARTLRARLKVDAHALVVNGIFEPALLENLSRSTSDLATASDLMALYVTFHCNRSRIEGKTAVTTAQIAELWRLSDEMLVAAHAHDKARTETTIELATTRRRVYTVFNRAYQQVVRAVTYLRWDEGDAQRYAPSLYERQSGKRKASAAVESAGETASAESAPEQPAPVRT